MAVLFRLTTFANSALETETALNGAQLVTLPNSKYEGGGCKERTQAGAGAGLLLQQQRSRYLPVHRVCIIDTVTQQRSTAHPPYSTSSNVSAGSSG